MVNFFKEFKEMMKGPNKAERLGLDDPVALETGWKVIKGWSGYFRARELFRLSRERWEFRTRPFQFLVIVASILAGLAFLVSTPYMAYSLGRFESSAYNISSLLLGAALFFPALFSISSVTKPMVFDKGKGFFWKGKREPNQLTGRKKEEGLIKIEDIHALQILIQQGGGKSGPSFQLNLVLENAERINISYHHDLKGMQATARELAEFLDVPVWDASSISWI